MSEKQQALKVLGLSEGATDEEIRLAYKKLSMRWHPDKNQGSSEATHMMQQLNAAKDRLGQNDYYSEDEYESECYDSEDDYDEDYDDEEDDEDDEFDPFSGPSMNFAAFLRMYARMRASGQIDDDGMFQPPGMRGGRSNDFCYCPECSRMRRMNKETDQKARREAARIRRMEEEAEAAAERAREEADKKVQQTDPKNSLAWKRGGESRERLVREHFLKQVPRLLLHEVTNSTMLLVLDAPDLSLLDNGKMPPKGVDWEVSYQSPADKKPQTLPALREYDNVAITKLHPGTEYTLNVRTGLAGNLTWSGTPDWGAWSKPQKFKTTGQAAQRGSGGGKGSKKKKNRDAAFAKLTRQDEQQQQQSDDEPEADEEQQQQQQQDESDEQQSNELTEQQEQQPVEKQQQQQNAAQQATLAAPAVIVSQELELSDTPEQDSADSNVGVPAAAEEPSAGAAAGAAAAAVPAGAVKHVPKFPQVCQYFSAGKCLFGNNCKYRHALDSDDKLAAAAAVLEEDSAAAPEDGGSDDSTTPAAHAAEVDKLDKLMGAICMAGGLPPKKAAEAAKLCNKIAARVPVARYQPAPVTPEGAYLRPLFLTAYNVLDNSYAAWYWETVLGGGAKKPSERKQALQKAMADQPAAATAEVRYQQSPAAAAAAPQQQQQQQQQQGSLPRGPNYKTKPCQWFAVGSCRFGDKCAFLHLLPDGTDATTGVAASTATNSSGGRELCRWFPLGTCKFGDKCAFRHVLPDGTEAATAKSGAAAMTNRVSGGDGGSSAAAAASSSSSSVQMAQQQVQAQVAQTAAAVVQPQQQFVQPSFQQRQQQYQQQYQQQVPVQQQQQQQVQRQQLPQYQQQQQQGYQQPQYHLQQQAAHQQQQQPSRYIAQQQLQHFQPGYQQQQQYPQHQQPYEQPQQPQQQYNPLWPGQQQQQQPGLMSHQYGVPGMAQPYRPF